MILHIPRLENGLIYMLENTGFHFLTLMDTKALPVTGGNAGITGMLGKKQFLCSKNGLTIFSSICWSSFIIGKKQKARLRPLSLLVACY